MTKAQHTPGAWRSYKVENRNCFEVVTVDINPLMSPDCKTPKAHICSVYAQHFDGCGATLQEAEANARLIAAAPELLEALRNLMSVTDENHPRWKEAAAIIAKAGGK